MDLKSRLAVAFKGASQNKKMREYYAAHYETNSIDEDSIVYETRDGRSIVDSPYAIFLELIGNPEYQNLKHTWIVTDDADIKRAIPDEYLGRVNFVQRGTKEYLDTLLAAHYVVSNSTLESFFKKRNGQVYINTWHGTPLKHMGFDTNFDADSSKNVLRNLLMADYVVSPNAHTTKIFSDGYKLRGIYPGKILEMGYPRIDQTLRTSKNNEVDKLSGLGLDIDETKPVLLYTPTWKGSNVSAANDDIEQLINETLALAAKVGDEFNVLIKVHPFVYGSIRDDKRVANRLVPDWMDPNEVLAAVDLLVTDYSSIFFDYLVTDKPIIFYSWDKDLYDAQRGMYFTTEELPGPTAENFNQLVEMIRNRDKYLPAFADRYSVMKNKIVPYDDGQVTKRLVDFVFGHQNVDGIKIIDVNSTKTKIVLYPGGMMDNGITTSFLNLTDNIDYDKYDVTVLMEVPNRQEKRKNIARMNSNVRPMFRFGNNILTKNEERLNNHFMEHGVAQNERPEFPLTGYQRESERLMANLEFDVAIDFSGYSYFWGRHILGINAKRHMAFMHNDLYADAHREVNGQFPMLRNLEGLFSIYYMFDKLLSVSPMTRDVNAKKLAKFVKPEQMKYVINTINVDKILNNKDEATDAKEVLIVRRSSMIFKVDEAVDVFTNIPAIIAHDSTPLNVKANDTVTVYAEYSFDNQRFLKVAINHAYVGWILDGNLKDAPLKIISEKKVNLVGTVSRYLGSPIRKSLTADDANINLRAKASQLKGQYVFADKHVVTDSGQYLHIKYLGKSLGWIAARTIQRKHAFSSASPLNFYFASKQAKLDKQLKIGISDTIYKSEPKFYSIVSPVVDNQLWTEAPGTTGSTEIGLLSDIKPNVFTVTEIVLASGKKYARLESNNRVVGYTAVANLLAITEEEYNIKANHIDEVKSVMPEFDVSGQVIPEFDSNYFNVVTMGRLSPEKNQISLINGFAEFLKSNPNSRLYLLGKGPLLPELMETIKANGVGKNVYLLGHIDGPFNFLKQTDLFILPSLYEGQPMVLLEALTLGMKLLVSNIPANIQVVGKDEKYGQLINGTSSEDIAAGLNRFVTDKPVFEKFDYQKYNAGAVESFYDEIAK
jgi:CDP-glycerol glycerophosphotransferase